MEINGVVVINKPQNMTSHDVVAIMRRKLKTKKIGHTGTLDPMATGVLPICIGKATKIVDFLMDRKKTYACEMKLGSATDTQDQWGVVVDQCDDFHLTEEEILDAVLSFVGEIDQIPPMYSALKIGGEKLVDLARKGIVVEREPRRRTVFEIKNIVVRQHTIAFEATCSKGTYIRTLCHDIGLKLGCYAHMTSLNRTLTEPFEINQAVILENLNSENVHEHIISIEEALSWMPAIQVQSSDELLFKVKNGQRVDFSKYLELEISEMYYKIYIDREFWGIGEKNDAGIFMKKVLRDDPIENSL